MSYLVKGKRRIERLRRMHFSWIPASAPPGLRGNDELRVVGCGLFVDQADVVFIESDDDGGGGDGEELERRARG